MNLIVALVLLLLVGFACWLLPIPGVVCGAAVFLIVAFCLIGLLRGVEPR